SRRSPPDAPTIGGRVEQAGEAGHPEGMLLSLDAPCPGIAHLFAMDMAGQVYLSIRYYLYGPDAPAIAAREEAAWKEWLAANFPGIGAGGPC
ncbi:MAG TPA: SRPBCC domain-containing protein, partial [Planctomycetia bacterium]|nr:SRPBCC domain-containing protein [Planctomycetia bacterium]